MLVIVGKNSLPEIFFLAVVFITGVFTLYEVITAKSFIKLGVHADLLSSQLAPYRSTVPLAVSIFSQLDLTASVHAAFTFLGALSRPVPCTSGPLINCTVFIVPKGLVGTHQRVDLFPSGSFSSKLVAGVGVGWSAPVSQEEAVVMTNVKSGS